MHSRRLRFFEKVFYRLPDAVKKALRRTRHGTFNRFVYRLVGSFHELGAVLLILLLRLFDKVFRLYPDIAKRLQEFDRPLPVFIRQGDAQFPLSGGQRLSDIIFCPERMRLISDFT